MQVKAMTLFATHYFELTRLADDHEGIVNVHLTAREHGDRIVFLHSVREGPANQSYGLQVARLAGLPQEVLARARRHLERLEAEAERAESAQMNLFAAQKAKEPARSEPDPIAAILDDVDPDALSPREALDAIYRLVHANRER